MNLYIPVNPIFPRQNEFDQDVVDILNCIRIEKSIPYSILMSFNYLPPLFKVPQGLRHLHEL